MKMVLNFHVLLFRIQQANEFWPTEAMPLMISQNTVDIPLEYLEVLLGTSGRNKSLPALADHLSLLPLLAFMCWPAYIALPVFACLRWLSYAGLHMLVCLCIPAIRK